MPEQDRQAGQFEHLRPRMRALAYPLLGSHAEAEAAVREVWVRLGRIDPAEVADLAEWLTTVTGRVCLGLLGARDTRPRRLPDVPVGPGHPVPADGSVGPALLAALDALAPAERVAFVLHEVFRLPVDLVATALDRTTADTRGLAEQARLRVHGARSAGAEGGPAGRRWRWTPSIRRPATGTGTGRH
ncbi:hypothetical protein ACIQWA_05960 [Kitasatospora sp. NPDC098652]|uniref:hypothetical protein n=1 Tax=Kitasatospora sp. NPDC098652 TaxID=3364095 RepID=UPI00380124A8